MKRKKTNNSLFNKLVKTLVTSLLLSWFYGVLLGTTIAIGFVFFKLVTTLLGV